MCERVCRPKGMDVGWGNLCASTAYSRFITFGKIKSNMRRASEFFAKNYVSTVFQLCFHCVSNTV